MVPPACAAHDFKVHFIVDPILTPFPDIATEIADSELVGGKAAYRRGIGIAVVVADEVGTGAVRGVSRVLPGKEEL